jgi:hypothetical protein
LISNRFAVNPTASWANFFTASRYRSRPRLPGAKAYFATAFN